ncbi:nitroreductase family protein [Candidatus Micrarchaeota archaeon]|nr:nitroreductase family protein [Candidatus Micrarchaeota archaeon]
MKTIEAILTRRSVREWLDKRIPKKKLIQILEAGRFAPSPLNSQPWHFIVIRNKKTFDRLVIRSKHAKFLSQADTLIVVTVDIKAKVDEWLAEHDQHTYSGVCAMQNMWLAAWDLGLGCCWVSLDDRSTKRILAIGKEQRILGGLAIGYPKNAALQQSKNNRKPLRDIVLYEEEQRI